MLSLTLTIAAKTGHALETVVGMPFNGLTSMLKSFLLNGPIQVITTVIVGLFSLITFGGVCYLGFGCIKNRIRARSHQLCVYQKVKQRLKQLQDNTQSIELRHNLNIQQCQQTATSSVKNQPEQMQMKPYIYHFYNG